MKSIIAGATLTMSLFLSTSLFANGADTVFAKTNPNLLYTTRDFYIEIPANCYSESLCIQDFFLIMTFNIGIDAKQVVQQAGFEGADLECSLKPEKATTFRKHTFTKYQSSVTDNGFGVIVEFTPDKINGAAPSITKFVFTGKMHGDSLKGMLAFHTASGITQIALN